MGPSSRKARVFIVDDHPIMRIGLAEVIGSEPDLEVCGEAGTMTEALQGIGATLPDVAVVDLALEQGSGLELIAQLKARYPEVKMLVSSMYEESLFAERALRAGAMGFVNKRDALDKLTDALREILAGRVFLGPEAANRLLRSVVAGDFPQRDPIASLSARELEVLELIGQGLTTQQIARKLQLSPKTIESHREKLKMKLNLLNSTQLQQRAVQWVLEQR